jgi:hypothetical protein
MYEWVGGGAGKRRGLLLLVGRGDSPAASFLPLALLPLPRAAKPFIGAMTSGDPSILTVRDQGEG